MKSIVFQYPRQKDEIRERLAGRKKLYDRNLIDSVNGIFKDVALNGDAAILRATRQFDLAELKAVRLDDLYVTECVTRLPAPLKEAVLKAIENSAEVNRLLMPGKMWLKEVRPGTFVGEKALPLESVGLWIPARKGPLISTALMLVTAAKTAGVKNIIAAVPPNRDGAADPSTVAAAKLAGATGFVCGNGVAIIAGFATGTASVPEVNGVFGPGPGGIAAAMSLAFSYGKKTVLGIGPTDCAIIADDTADPDVLAFDLMNEAEHGPDSSAVLFTDSRRVAERSAKKLFDAMENVVEPRYSHLKAVFGDDGYGAIVLAGTIDECCGLANDYAPEHLMVQCAQLNRESVLGKIRNAAEVLLGAYTPFSAANYAIGITAVLPTSGYAAGVSGVTCRDMLKFTTIGELDRKALSELLPVISEIGNYENLPCHVKAADVRFKK